MTESKTCRDDWTFDQMVKTSNEFIASVLAKQEAERESTHRAGQVDAAGETVCITDPASLDEGGR